MRLIKGGIEKEMDMSWFDMLLAAGILAAAGWVFYKSYIKKRGSCAGCSGCAGDKEDKGKDRLVQPTCNGQNH